MTIFPIQCTDNLIYAVDYCMHLPEMQQILKTTGYYSPAHSIGKVEILI
jgi:hypothetical protein